MDLSHQVNTKATINLFCVSNITYINFDITYYLADTYCWWSISFNLFLKLERDDALRKSPAKLFQVLIVWYYHPPVVWGHQNSAWCTSCLSWFQVPLGFFIALLSAFMIMLHFVIGFLLLLGNIFHDWLVFMTQDIFLERKAGTKERSPDGLSLPNQNTILMNIIWYYFTRYLAITMKFN